MPDPIYAPFPSPRHVRSHPASLWLQVSSFDADAFRSRLADLLYLSSPDKVQLSIAPASVFVRARVLMPDLATADEAQKSLRSTPLPVLSLGLGVSVEAVSVSALSVTPPEPVAPLTLLPMGANPVALTTLLLLALNALSLYSAWRLRGLSGKAGLLGWWRSRQIKTTTQTLMEGWRARSWAKKLAFDEAGRAERAARRAANSEAIRKAKEEERRQREEKRRAASADACALVACEASAPSAVDRLALTGPPAMAARLPTLAITLVVEGELASFEQDGLTRRLATLLGIEDEALSATAATGDAESTVRVELLASFANAASLVTAARLLRKRQERDAPLGVALGVTLAARPVVKIVDDEADARGDDDDGRGVGFGSRASNVSARVPTIQERMPVVGGALARSSTGSQLRMPTLGLPSARIAPSSSSGSLLAGKGMLETRLPAPRSGLTNRLDSSDGGGGGDDDLTPAVLGIQCAPRPLPSSAPPSVAPGGPPYPAPPAPVPS